MVSCGTVISGSLRSEDLAPAFVDELRALSPERLAQVQGDYPRFFAKSGNVVSERSIVWRWFLASDFVNALMDALNDCAPEGLYFGASEGDGADFGFWMIQEADYV